TLRTEATRFDLGAYARFLDDNAASIAEFRDTQRTAFAEERARWEVAGLTAAPAEPDEPPSDDGMLPDGCEGVNAPLAGNVLRVLVAEGDPVEAGQTVAVLESMKMEFPAVAGVAGTVRAVRCKQGGVARAGQVLAVVERSEQ